MTLYRYRAVVKGTIEKGTHEAVSPLELRAYLREQELTLLSYSRVFSKRVKPRVLMDFCLHLEQFENAGISLKESIEDLYLALDSSKLRFILKDVIKDIDSGHLFSKALSKHPTVFDPIFVGLIAVGEKTGRLSFVLNQLSQHLKWIDEVQAQTIKALRYPLFMAMVLFLLLIVLMTVLVPELIVFLRNQTGELPTSTRILVACSSFLSNYILLLSCGIGTFGTFLMIFLKIHSKGLLWKDIMLTTLPLIGPLRAKLALAQFCHIFAVLFESGIDILQALQTARKSLIVGQMSHELEKVEVLIREGVSLSQAFEKTGYFPKMIVHMVKIGEQTSSLQKTLLHVKEYLDTTLKRQIDHVIGLIEPIMILAVGLMMVWIIYSIFLPLYDTLSLVDK